MIACSHSKGSGGGSPLSSSQSLSSYFLRRQNEYLIKVFLINKVFCSWSRRRRGRCPLLLLFHCRRQLAYTIFPKLNPFLQSFTAESHSEFSSCPPPRCCIRRDLRCGICRRCQITAAKMLLIIGFMEQLRGHCHWKVVFVFYTPTHLHQLFFASVLCSIRGCF